LVEASPVPSISPAPSGHTSPVADSAPVAPPVTVETPTDSVTPGGSVVALDPEPVIPVGFAPLSDAEALKDLVAYLSGESTFGAWSSELGLAAEISSGNPGSAAASARGSTPVNLTAPRSTGSQSTGLPAPQTPQAPAASSGAVGVGSSGSSGPPPAVLLALFAVLAAAALGRMLQLSAAVWRPVAFVSPLERPG
jgi:hypothetical protein